jgi:hypothetical protein
MRRCLLLCCALTKPCIIDDLCVICEDHVDWRSRLVILLRPTSEGNRATSADAVFSTGTSSWT